MGYRRQSPQAAERRYVNNGPAAGLEHLRNGRLTAIHKAFHIDCQRQIQILAGLLKEIR